MRNMTAVAKNESLCEALSEKGIPTWICLGSPMMALSACGKLSRHSFSTRRHVNHAQPATVRHEVHCGRKTVSGNSGRYHFTVNSLPHR